MNIEITDRQLRAFKRFVELLPHGKELDLVILKGHLLIEEQMNLLIDERLKNRSALAEGKLDYFARICLAQSFFPPDFEPWLWRSLKQLNKLRNSIAHNVEPKGVSDLIDDLVQSFPGDVHRVSEDRETRFEFLLWSMFDAVSELVEGPKAKVVELPVRDET